MRKYSIAWLLILTATFAFATCAITVQLKNASLREQVSELEFKLEEEASKANALEKSNASLVDRNSQLGLGLAFVAKTSTGPETNTKLLDQLRKLHAASMSCSVETFPDMPNVRLLVFRSVEHNKPKPDYISRLFVTPPPIFDPSVCVLVKHNSFAIVDSVSHAGENGGGYLLVNQSQTLPWSIHWPQPDGSEIKYKITERGFASISATEN